MSDFIDRRFLLNHLKDWQKEVSGIGYEREYNLLEQIVKGVENEPTAYDVDKVVEQLEDEITATRTKCPVRVEFDKGIYKAIEIVKAGGVNE